MVLNYTKYLIGLCAAAVGLGFSGPSDVLAQISDQAYLPRSPLVMVSARDHIPGSFVRPQSVYADRARIFAGSAQGQLFVLSRDQASNFPLLETIDIGSAVNAVRGDVNSLFVVSKDGNLRIFKKDFPLSLVATLPLCGFGLDSMANLGINTYVSEGHAELAVDQRRVYFSALKDGDVAVEVKKGDLTGMVYGKVFSPFQTMVYDRKNGTMLAVLPNPPGGQVALAGDRRRLYQTVPGCCGSGIVIVNKDSLAMEQFIDRFATNTVTCANQPSKDWLVGGTEFGIVDLFDLSVAPAALIASVNLPQATGHTVFGDIEIRSLWVDGLDNLVLAGSSWGSDSSHNPDLPSLFVLELRQ